ncbi:MAG: carboxypeptidase-like regulatory domain-containing protein [Alphaproteobacteria bacterium]
MKTRAALAIVAATITVLAFGPVGMAASYSEVVVTDGGTITGKLTFEGELPADAVEQIPITKNPDVCGTGSREVVWVDVKEGALRGAFVFIDKIKKGKKWAKPKDGKYIINQKGCRFIPWAQVIRPGPITIRNSDSGVLHNINTREMIGVEKGRVVKRTIFNFGQPNPGDIEETIKPRRSPYIAINCEAHNFMFGYMMAPKHPYAVVVGEDGSYTITDVPPGKYTLKAWHPRLGVKKVKITLSASGTVKQDFKFSQ